MPKKKAEVEVPVAGTTRLKTWPTKPKQDKAAETGTRHVPEGGEVQVPVATATVPVIETEAIVEEAVVQETGDERRARQRGEIADSGPFVKPGSVATTESVEG